MLARLGAFLRRHKKAETLAAEAVGMVVARRLLAAVGLTAGIASAAVFALPGNTYHPAYTMSAKGLAFVERHEGVVLHPYQDPAGIPACTAGAGHVIAWRYCTKAELRETISSAQVATWLQADTGTARACITSRITYHLTQYQYEALVDLVFNAGCGSLYYRNVVGLVNAGALGSVPAALSRTAVTAGGRYLASLYQRRLDEGVLFSRGYYGDGIGYFTAPRPLTAAQKAEARLRAKTGYYAWLAWYLHEGAWRAYAVHASVVRPHVPARVPASWWRRERAFLKARAS